MDAFSLFCYLEFLQFWADSGTFSIKMEKKSVSERAKKFYISLATSWYGIDIPCAKHMVNDDYFFCEVHYESFLVIISDIPQALPLI